MCQKILSEHKNVREFIVVSIKSPNDLNHGAAKSGDMLAYFFRMAMEQSGGKVSIFTDFRSRKFATLAEKRDSMVIAVDDFVGTGDTALKFLAEFQKVFPDINSRFAIATLVTMKSAKEKISGLGVKIFSHLICEKGITDHAKWSYQEKIDRTNLMKTLETRIKVLPQYRLGYGQSESLIKMMRTPNNTFPVFWHTTLYDNIPWPSPFPRHWSAKR